MHGLKGQAKSFYYYVAWLNLHNTEVHNLLTSLADFNLQSYFISGGEGEPHEASRNIRRPTIAI
jgi:hypothetical protein